ncbi:MAG: hypothetical protein O7E52_01970 [Candidatus Poribacteria bacterium]|nr:hypothetical protein [Candidatus Poribacteria bacterium]
MAQNIPDLWPDDIAVTNDLKPPVAILRQQAALLGEKTQNLVEAEISSSSIGSGFRHHFNLVVPALDNYRFRLFYITHPISLYPINISVSSPGKDDTVIEVKSEDEFTKALRGIFSSEETKRIIQALIAQSQA